MDTPNLNNETGCNNRTRFFLLPFRNPVIDFSIVS
jgi:hypothetical protein